MLYAHTGQSGSLEDGQPLEDHLRSVAKKCSEFAKPLGYENWGDVSGCLHDTGKASEPFQERLAGSSMRVDHATAGAQLCKEIYGGSPVEEISSTLMSLAIAGHHGGMPNVISLGNRTPLKQRLEKDLPDYKDAFNEVLVTSSLSLPSKQDLEPVPPLRNHRNLPAGLSEKGQPAFAACNSFSLQLLGRLLFSCLVDADYLDTERVMTPEVSSLRNRNYESLDALLEKLDRHLTHLQEGAPSTPVNEARSQILADCTVAADWDPGLFTLSVPTGGGKTLSSMKFALRHAVLHNKTRVIYAIPFTSVAQQTAAVFRSVFGSSNVLEHHSAHVPVMFDDEHESESDERAKAERLATQNWDAPIIVTTNVQLLESLYSNMPSKCRKLHNVANSVIVFDEAQSLPDALLKPTLAVIEGLCIDFGTSAVLCTATQPALDNLWPFGSKPREISIHCDSFKKAFSGRVRFEPLSNVGYEGLARELCSKTQALCVVGTKKKARELYENVIRAAKEDGVLHGAGAAQEGFYHLSTNMVAAHRMCVLREIRHRLANGMRCVVVSTQLIEAGVDVDFPEAYREIAGIDSLLQVAGRCNREGSQKDEHGDLCPGTVHVFEFEEDSESGGGNLVRSWLGAMKSISKNLLQQSGGVVTEDLVAPFFSTRYATNADELDRGNILRQISGVLASRCETLDYESYARQYKIIEDNTEAVYVAWDEEGGRLIDLARKLATTGEESALFVPLQQYSVGVYPHVLKQLVAEGDVEEVGKYYVLNSDPGVTRYSAEKGLLPLGEEELNDLII